MGFREIVKGISGYLLKENNSCEEDMEEVIFLDKEKKTGSEICLHEIEKFMVLCNEDEKEKINKKVNNTIIKGINGEKQTKRKLGYCDFYCNILSDIKLSNGDLENQIDFLVITKKMCFIIECKNITNTTKVLPDGRFAIGRYQSGKWKSEKILSPIEQNHEHVQLVKNIYKRNVSAIADTSKNKITNEYFRPILVWGNNNSKIDWLDASEDIKNEIEEQFVYLERLITYMNKIYNESSLPEKSLKEVKELSQIFYDIHKKNEEEYNRKNKQWALQIILKELEGVTPQELLRRELMHYRMSDFVNQTLRDGRIKNSYRENLLNEAMIEQIIEIMPKNIWELEDKIYNSGPYTRKYFGEDILEIIDKYRNIIE